MHSVDSKQAALDAINNALADNKDKVQKGKDSGLFAAMFDQIKQKTNHFAKESVRASATQMRQDMAKAMSDAQDNRKRDDMKLRSKEDIEKAERKKEDREKRIEHEEVLKAQKQAEYDEQQFISDVLNSDTALSSGTSSANVLRPSEVLANALARRNGNSDGLSGTTSQSQATSQLSGDSSQFDSLELKQSYTEFSKAVVSGKISNEEVKSSSGYLVSQTSSNTQAAQAFSQLDATDENIEIDLNQINRNNLSSLGNNQEPKSVSESERIASLDDQDLRKNLDTLAREGNVTKLSLQMANPQTQASARRDAAALANLPKSNDTIANLTAPQQSSNNLLNHLGASANSGAQVVNGAAVNNQAVAQGASHNITSNASANVNYANRAFAQSNSNTQASFTQGASAQTAPKAAPQSAQSTLLEMTSGGMSQSANRAFSTTTSNTTSSFSALSSTFSGEGSLRTAHLATAQVNSSAQSALSQAVNALQNMSGGNSTASVNPYLTGELAAPTSYAYGVGGLSEAAVEQDIKEDLVDGSLSSTSISASLGSQQVQQEAKAEVAQEQANVNLNKAAQEATSEIHEQVMQMAARNMKQLSVELNPEHLGKMKIVIELSDNNDAVSLAIGAQNAKTREALEQALPQLRDILAQQGVHTDANIYDVTEEQNGHQQGGQGGQGGQHAQDDQRQKREEEQKTLANVKQELGLSLA